MDVRSALCALRAAVFSAVCVALTALGHGLADGHAVGPAALGAGLVAVFVPALACARRERSQRAITAGVLAGEAGLHLLFTFAKGPVAAVPMFGHAGPELAMLVGHLGVAVIAGWWLRRGEASCWRLLRRGESVVTAAATTLANLVGLLDGPGAHRHPVRSPRPHGAGGGTAALLAYCAPGRGPPRELRSVRLTAEDPASLARDARWAGAPAVSITRLPSRRDRAAASARHLTGRCRASQP
jgi:hypothetical protein